jgi:hypothetical protein
VIFDGVWFGSGVGVVMIALIAGEIVGFVMRLFRG